MLYNLISSKELENYATRSTKVERSELYNLISSKELENVTLDVVEI